MCSLMCAKAWLRIARGPNSKGAIVCVCVTWFGAVWCLGTGPLAMPGYFRLSQLTLGANSLVQSIIPTVRRKSLRDAHVIRVFLTVRGGRIETAVQ